MSNLRRTGNYDSWYVIKWKKILRYWPFVRGIHPSPVNSPHKGQWRGALKFSFVCAWINGWVNNREADDLRRHRAHYDVFVMLKRITAPEKDRHYFESGPRSLHKMTPCSIGSNLVRCWLIPFTSTEKRELSWCRLCRRWPHYNTKLSSW